MAAATTGKGYGKVILFGEHFVVYGLPGIAAGIDKFVEVKAEKIKDSLDTLIDDPAFFKEKVSVKDSPEHIKSRGIVAMFKDEPEVSLKGLKITFGGYDLQGGLGLSSALGVAIARAVSNLFLLKWKDEKINEVAYRWETVGHGNPSGIDNTCATYGTLIWYEKGKENEKSKFRPLKCGKPIFLVIGDTGVEKKTAEAIEKVKKWKEENPKDAEKIFGEAKKLVGKAKLALKFGEIEEVGKLVNQNQLLLQKIGVSNPEIEKLIRLATFEGALGAKLTGGGLGGKVIALCENEKGQDKIISAFERNGYKAIKAKIN